MMKCQEQLLTVTKQLLDRGVVNDLEFNKVQVELHELMAQEPLLHAAVAKAIHRLSILLGYSPGVLAIVYLV